MNFPLISQVAGKSLSSKDWSINRNYPLTESEKLKVNAVFEDNKVPWTIDDPTSYEKFLRYLDVLFGDFIQVFQDRIVYRGKLDYKGEIQDPDTGEPNIVFSLSDPQTLYRKVNTPPVIIRVPRVPGMIGGFYAKITVKKNSKNRSDMLFTEWENITNLKVEMRIPTLFLDYSQFSDLFRINYCFDITDTTQKYRGMTLNNIDLLLLNKIAGENFQSEVKGAINFNVVKTTHDQGHRELGVVNTFLDQVTSTPHSKTVYSENILNCGSLASFKSKVENQNRDLALSPFNNYYGCNVGFSLSANWASNLEKEQILGEVKNSSIDYINRIGRIATVSPSRIQKLLKMDPLFMYSSRALFTEALLLPIESKIQDIKGISGKKLRLSTALKKFEDCIDILGTDETMEAIKMKESTINFTDEFIKDNEREFEEFI